MVTSAKKLTRDNVLLIIVAGIASYLDAALLVSLGVALPIWLKTMQLNSWEIDFISTLLTLSVAAGSFIGGWLSDKFGRITVFNFDIFFVAVGALIIATATRFAVLLIGVTIAGLASGADLPTSLAVISERMSKKAYGRAISSTQIFWTMGILLSQFIGFITASAKQGSVLILFSWIALVAFIDWCVRVFSHKIKNIEAVTVDPNPTTKKTLLKKQSLKSMLGQRTTLLPLFLLTVFYLFWNLPANTWGSFVNYFLVTIDNQSQAFSTAIAIAANLFCLLLNVLYVKVADTKYRYKVMYVGIAVAFISFVVAGTFSAYWQAFTVAYICYSGSTVLCGEALYKIWNQSFYPISVRATMTGFSYGIVRAFTALFSLITPTLMGYSPKLLLWLLVGCTLIFGITAIVIVHLLKRFNIQDAGSIN